MVNVAVTGPPPPPSSLTIVATPVPSAIVAPTGFDSPSVNVSVGSTVVSPTTGTLTVVLSVGPVIVTVPLVVV